MACLLRPAAARGQEGSSHLRITSEPAGAAVSLDGAMRDVTPLVVPNLKPGRHLLILKKEGFREARKSVVLQPDQRMVLDIRLEPITGLLLVHSVPPGASVTIDSAHRGRTPLLISDLVPGAYRLQIAAAGHQAKEVEVRIKDRTPRKIVVSLKSDSGRLVLSSQPPGAAVLLNGISSGVTPCTLNRVPAGESTLELTAAGYAPYKRTVKLHAGQVEEMTIILKPMPSQLQIVSIPARARIYIDDQYRGEAPVTLQDIEPGSYRVRAELPGYEVTARTISVERNTQVVEEFRLDSSSGALEITTEPAGVKVLVSGKDSGVTTSDPEETDRVSKPLRIELLKAGEHKLTLTRKGFYDKNLVVVIKKEQTVTLHQKLVRRFIPNYEVKTRSGVERGVLVERDVLGNIRLEVRPGILKTIAADQIVSHRPLREQ
jgi:hypothetical protein